MVEIDLRNWWERIDPSQSMIWRFRSWSDQMVKFESERSIMPIDMKDPANVKRFTELFVKKKSELSLTQYTPDQLLDHIKNLEGALDVLIFESRAEIQGARDFLEESKKNLSEQERKKLIEKDKKHVYRPSLNQIEESQRQAKKAASVSNKSAAITQYMQKFGCDKAKADLMFSLTKAGMSEEAAAKMVGIQSA